MQILPFKEYVDSLDDALSRTLFKARIALVTGKSPSSISRYLSGRVRPEYLVRNAIAADINDGRTGDDLFPTNYPYGVDHVKTN